MPDQRDLIAAVAEGMPVIDSTGESVGAVRLVQMGDPEAVTAPEHEPGSEPRLDDDEQAARLLRLGFIKIGHKGLFGHDRYAAADDIADVAQDTVILAVPAGHLVTA